MTASFNTHEEAGGLVLVFTGPLSLNDVGKLWNPVLAAARTQAPILDVTAMPSCDTAGATLLAVALGDAGEVRGANAEVTALLKRVRAARTGAPAGPSTPDQPVLREMLRRALHSTADAVAFVGEVTVATIRAPRQRRMVPLRDVLAFTDGAGVQAMPLIMLLGFLMGLILAFQSSIPLRRFGAEIYVVNLVTISLLRELGPLLAAVILAGRTGSAFAAELGTMVVNDEVAAIRTMGIDPVTMLVLPRLLAALLVMPGLALLMEISGLVGMTVVMGVLGYPPVAVLHQATQSARLRDLLGGLFKASVFGAAVAVIGCRTGLGAGLGPRAVGQAATAAVVGGIFATIVLDGVFTILFFRLGL